MVCPLCSIGTRDDETVFYADEHFTVVRTKNRKGHEERVMIVSHDHKDELTDKEFDDAMLILDSVIPEIFNYTYKAVVMEGKYGSIKNHTHFVITDLEEGSTDHAMILGTPWLKVIEVRDWL